MSLKILSIGVLVGSVALLSGCAANSMHLDSHSPLRNSAYVKANFLNRAFTLGSVTVATNQVKPAYDHPLPAGAYLKMIRHELKEVFSSDHLGAGVKPAYIVNVNVSRLHFISDNEAHSFWGNFSMNELTHVTSTLTIVNASGLSLASVKIKPYDAGRYFYGYWHAPSWDYCRRTIPLTAIFTANVLNRLREGKTVTNSSLGGEGALIFQKVDDRELGRYSIKSLSKKEIEDITGYSRQQLHDFDKPW